MDNTTWGATAPALHKNGYLPVPILPKEKRPTVKNWREFRYRETDATKYAGCGCGILCGEVRCIDIDIRNEQVATLVERAAIQSLGIANRAPRRIGAWPKVLFLVRSEPGQKITSRPYLLDSDTFDNDPHKVEILGEGQQAVCYGIHPITGRPYTWNGAGEPTTVPVDSLPYVSDKALRAFVAEAEAIMAEYGRPCGTLGRSDSGAVHAPSDELRAPVELVADALSYIPNNALSRDDWVLMAHAIKGACGDDGRDLFIRWSRSSSKSGKSGATDTPEHVWESCKPTRIGAGTVFFEAKRNGWARPAPEPPELEEIPLEAYAGEFQRRGERSKKSGQDDRVSEEPEPDGSVWDSSVEIGSLLDSAPAPVRWFAVDRLQLGRGVLLTGLGGSSKTRFLYHMGIGGALGRVTWSWQIASRGRSVLVLTEDTVDDVHRTLYGMRQAMGISKDEIDYIKKNLVIYALAGKNAEILNRDKSGTLSRTMGYERLKEKILSIGSVVFVGLDPALGLSGGDEMDQHHQRMLGKAVDDLAVTTGSCVMLNSHASKASGQADEPSSHTSRGGGAITDAVRGEYTLRSMTAKEAREAGISDPEERRRHVQLVCTKGNHVPPAAFVPEWLRRGDNGVLSAASVEFGAVEAVTAVDLRAHGVLVSLAAVRVPKFSEWRDACLERNVFPAKSDDAIKKAMQRTIRRLLAGGYITKGMGNGVYLPVGDESGDI